MSAKIVHMGNVGSIAVYVPPGATTVPGDRFTYAVTDAAPKPTGNRLARRTAEAQRRHVPPMAHLIYPTDPKSRAAFRSVAEANGIAVVPSVRVEV